MKGSSHSSKSVTYSALKLLEHQFQPAWASRDLDQCVHLLGKVLQINPRSANALLQLGRTHGIRYEYDEAIKCFEKAVEVSPKKQNALVLVEAGRIAKDFFDPGIAESFFQEAVEVAGIAVGQHALDDLADAKIALAEHLMRSRKREMASSLVDEVLENSPKDADALLLWCRLNETEFEQCVERLEMLLRSEDVELKVKAAYQLAKISDKSGDYDGAMRALSIAKSSLMGARDPIVLHRRNIRAEIVELAKGFTSTKRAEWKAAALDFGDPKKLAMLGGHPRSGTTLLEQVLDSHPDVISVEESENLNIFSYAPLLRKHFPKRKLLEVLDACSLQDLNGARENYWDAMEKCIQEPVGSRILVDKNPSLTVLAPELFRFFPEIKFVTMIRDPRDVIVSCYMQAFFPPDAISGNFLTMEDTVEEVESFMSIWTDLSGRFDGNVCEVRYEEMVEDLEGNARKVLGFLGLEWSDSVMEYDQHAREKIVRSPTAEAVTEKVHSRAVSRWKNYEKYLEPHFDQLAPILEKLDYS